MRHRVDIKDVARIAGVSPTTVSHALNDKGRLHYSTRQWVRTVAEELGYQPNLNARSLAGGRSGLIGLAVAQVDESQFTITDFVYYSQLMQAATMAAIESGYVLALASGTKAGAWSNLSLDGLVVVDPVEEDPLYAEFSERNIPIVTTGRLPGADEDEGCWVDSDHFSATPAILDHLAARGAKRIALIGAPPVTTFATDAHEAYELWCEDHEQDPIVVTPRQDLSESAGYDATLKLLRGGEPPDAIYAMLDRLALGALLAAKAQGLLVPDELQIAACTDGDAAKIARPALTALSLNPEAIGRQAIGMLVELIEEEEPGEPRVFVPWKIVRRGSTRRRPVYPSTGRRTTAHVAVAAR